MKIITHGDIVDGGQSVFTSVVMLDEKALSVSFKGAIRVDNPYKHLQGHLDELGLTLPRLDLQRVEVDFSELRFCNSNGFYIIMDLVEVIYRYSKGPITVTRLAWDDWQQETLPILIDVDDPRVAERTTFRDLQL